MAKIAANITLLFPDLPLLDRIGEAKALGFDGVECLFPYAAPAAQFRQALDHAGLPCVLINMPVPDWDQGGRGCGAVPGAQDQFRAHFMQALDYARTCDVPRIHVLAGNTDDPRAFDTFVENLRWACDQAPDRVVLIEPLNPKDMPGYWLNDFARAADVIEAVGRDNLGLQYDLWHGHQITQVWRHWSRIAPYLAHVQFAGLQSRGAPDARCMQALRTIAFGPYRGWFSAEYYGQPGEQAAWLPPLREALRY